MKNFKNIVLAICLLVTLVSKGQILPVHLTTEMADNPLAVVQNQPRFSWQLIAKESNASQIGYQILVASSEEKLKNDEGDIWNSLRINSYQNLHIAFGGSPLKPETKYFWKVKVWNQEGEMSKWSRTAFFRIAPNESDLKPIWIGAITKADSHLPEGRNYHSATYKREKKDAIINASDSLSRRSIILRKPFKITKEIKEAVVYISGLGHYELTINGKKIGNSEFAPLWTDYDKTVNYNTYELSAKELQKGENVIGVLLGNGMYNTLAERYTKFFVSFGPPTLFFKMKVVYKDGSEEIIKSDESWKYSKSPITYNSIFGGEDYNANLEQKDWNEKGFKDSNWKKIVVQEAPKGILRAQTAPPITIQKQYDVASFKELKPNFFVFNMGQNLSGFTTIKVKGKKGQTVRVWVGEGLNEDGTVGQGRSGKPYYYDYTLKGDGVEEWQPKFSYYGFQYVQIENINYKENKDKNLPTLVDLKSNFIYNSAGEAGTFESSNTIFNKAHELINNSIKSNFQSVFTDCPQREKLGWLEEIHLNGPGLMFNYNLESFIPATMQNISDSQREDGLIPTIVPEYVVFGGDFTDSPEWGVTGVILPWMYYEYYGDASLLEKYYPVMKKYVDYLGTKAKDHIVSHGLGDWYDYGTHAAGYSKNSPIALSATSHYFYGASLVAKAAKLLNKTEDISEYETLASDIKTAFNKEFFNPETKQYGTNSQFSNAVPVYMDIVEPQYKAAVMQNLLADIKAKGDRLTTGDVGNRYLFQALAQNGENETMYKMNNHYDAPGYGFQIKFGLTTLTEQWDPRKGNSWNHFMMGQIEEWFYQSLAGIVPDPENPGFKHFFIQPQVVGDMTFVKATYKSVYGNIASEWEKKDGKLILKVEIPVNTSATIKLPIAAGTEVKVNGKVTKYLRFGSGKYTIECKI
ncbi:glycoside hydrolase family 78 protein [Flavobacterium pectinovorum]|uniref:alpha-L-rhamnosidase n=1 Tax=Flavobacterium pectinovorum TaxID=29533 RepID=A0AB36P5F9_9FLAO|nr:glycoside hydrolase family 78 protein [Flavobacterium pectinovorum]OXB07429.1 hydrolase [Flavobacterium pectinovorum]SHM66527.1 Alpha-L-rhamnosidase N-terminal domain-containing protein [Flavobacterium pectinovorum]